MGQAGVGLGFEEVNHVRAQVQRTPDEPERKQNVEQQGQSG